MAVYNTPSDAANTAVRAFLTSVGEFYLGASFNTASGRGKSIWQQILSDFEHRCAYCGSAEKLQIEHLVMFNRTEYGLHHPGNVVPVCRSCNERQKDDQKRYIHWKEQLAIRAGGIDSPVFQSRLKRIIEHQRSYRYPELSLQERNAIAVIAESLYENIKAESEKSLAMYKKLDAAFVRTPK